MVDFNQRKRVNTVSLFLFMVIVYSNSSMMMFSYDMCNCSKINKVDHINYPERRYLGVCKNMMCNFEK